MIRDMRGKHTKCARKVDKAGAMQLETLEIDIDGEQTIRVLNVVSQVMLLVSDTVLTWLVTALKKDVDAAGICSASTTAGTGSLQDCDSCDDDDDDVDQPCEDTHTTTTPMATAAIMSKDITLPHGVFFAKSKLSFIVKKAKCNTRTFKLRAKLINAGDIDAEIDNQRRRALHYHATGVVDTNDS